MQRTMRTRLVAGLMVFGLAAAACGSDDDTSTDDTSTSDTAAEATDDTAADTPAETAAAEPADEADAPEDTSGDSGDSGDGETGEATGEPVLLATIMDEDEAVGQFFPEQRAAIAAAVNYVNANGGLGGSGRPIEVDICIGLGDPDENAECGRQIVASEAIAMIGGAICRNDTAYPILNEASPAVPNIGSLSCLPSTHESPNTFLVNNGLEGSSALSSAVACSQGATSMGVVLIEIPPILAQAAFYEQGNTCGMELTQVNMGPATGDGGPIAAQILGTDYAATLLAPPQGGPVLAAASQQAYDGTFIMAPTNMNRVILDATAGSNEGVLLARWTRPSDSGVAGYDTYRAELEALGEIGGRPAVEWIDDEFGTQVWVAIMAANAAYANCPTCEFDRDGMQQAMSQLDSFDADGITPMLDFTNPGQGFVGRSFTAEGFVGVIESGEVKTFGDGAPIDPLAS